MGDKTCEQIVGFKVNQDGEPIDDVVCGRKAVALLGRSPICARCIVHIAAEDTTTSDILHGLAELPEDD